MAELLVTDRVHRVLRILRPVLGEPSVTEIAVLPEIGAAKEVFFTQSRQCAERESVVWVPKPPATILRVYCPDTGTDIPLQDTTPLARVVHAWLNQQVVE